MSTVVTTTCPITSDDIRVPVRDVWLTQTSGPRPGLTTMQTRTYEWGVRGCPACRGVHIRPTENRAIVALLIQAGVRIVGRPAELDDPKRRTTTPPGHRPQPRLSIDDVITLDHDLAHLHLWGQS